MPSLRYSSYKVDIECPYNAELVDKLKLHIPPKSREWSPEKRLWTVFTPYMTTARNLVLGYFPNAVEYNREAFDNAEAGGESKKRAEWVSGPNPFTQKPPPEDEWEYFFGADGSVYRTNTRTGKTESSREFGGFNFGRGNSGRSSYSSGTGAQFEQHKNTVYDVLFVIPSAPEQVVRAAYKALAILHHPDKQGGDTVTMQTINRAFDEIKKQKGWK